MMKNFVNCPFPLPAFWLAAIILPMIFSACGPNIEKSQSHLLKGIDLTFQAQHSEALVEFNQAIKFNDHSFEAYYYRAACKRNLKDNDGAMADYKKAIELKPDYAEAHFGLGQLYDYLQDRQMACFHYLKAESLGLPNVGDYTRWCK
ncbi:MAG: tetratricopeptide repeat protein [Bacteroidales bacterium]|nr:tetratricopeptide repeat protein [Bacteroidales bacterium]